MREKIRSDIQRQADAFFGRSVSLDDRVFECLSTEPRAGQRKKGGRQKHSHKVEQLWKALVEALPLLWSFYAAIDYRPRSGQNVWPTVIVRPIRRSRYPGPEVWLRTFRSIFADFQTGKPSPGPYDLRQLDLTLSGQQVRQSGQLTAVAFASTLLQVRWRMASAPRHLRPSPVAQQLIRRTEGRRALHWSPAVGSYVERAVHVLEGLAQLDASLGSQQFQVSFDGTKYRLAPFGAVATNAVADPAAYGEAAVLIRLNAVQRPKVFAPEALGELEELINEDAPERVFQAFFEANPEFLLALGPYQDLHAQVVLHQFDGSTLVPDFLLERLDSDFCDILDLKRPSAELVKKKGQRSLFRSSVMDAVGQLADYRRFFDNRTNRQAFERVYGRSAYKPRVIIVMGRKQSYFDEVQRAQLGDVFLPGWVDLRTYDDVIAEARRWRRWALGTE